MILSDRDIAERLDEGDLVIDPIEDFELQIQPASVDCTLGNDFLVFRRGMLSHIRPDDPRSFEEHMREVSISDDDEFVIHPGDFALATTKERIEIPPDLIGHVEGRSSLGRLAVVVHATAGLCDPGYKGQVTLELSNLGSAPVALTPGMRVSQLTFTELKSPAERPYGSERGSKYQDQDGPVASRIADDPDV